MRKYLCTLYDDEGQVIWSMGQRMAEGPSQAAAEAAEEYGEENTARVHVHRHDKDEEPFVYDVTMRLRCESVRYVRGTGPSPE